MDTVSYLLGKKAGGGSGGTSNYEDLTNKPSINGVTLSGDKSSEDLGINDLELTIDEQRINNSDYISTIEEFITKNLGNVVHVNVVNGTLFVSEGYIHILNTVNNFTPTTTSLTKFGVSLDTVQIQGSWSNDEYSINLITIVNYDTSKALPVNNTTVFVPTSDYQPATKKYVDDNAGGESDANVYYLGKTNLYNTEENALDLNSLKIGRYYFKHDSNNNTLWVKATYKGDGAEPTTKTLQITLFDDFSSTNPKKPVVIQNTIMLYIDKEFDENTVVLSSLGSITSSFKDDNHGLVNNYFTISLGTVSILLGTRNYEYCNLTTQYSTMPTATSSTVGKIVQYIGITNNTYTNGYFYIGTTDGAITPTYGWSNINVQSSSGDKLTTYSNYDASKTQILKNINGVLQWVTEE